MSASPNPDVPCRSCTDFKTWTKAQTQKNPAKGSKAAEKVTICDFEGDEYLAITHCFISHPFQPKVQSAECPLDKDQLGTSTWNFLHTMAAYFPSQPSPDQTQRMTKFLNILPDFYPCQHCAEDLKIE